MARDRIQRLTRLPRGPFSQSGAGDLFGSAVLLLGLAVAGMAISTGDAAAGHSPTPQNFKVAFIGDQGLSSNAVAVLNLIKDEGTDMVLHQGDFDYSDNPDAWDQQINGVLGDDFPYFASVGNHDEIAWPGYQGKLQARLNKVACQGRRENVPAGRSKTVPLNATL